MQRWQDFKATTSGINPDFNDYRISLGKTFADGWSGALQISENRNTAFFNGSMSNLSQNDTRDIGKRRIAVSVTQVF